MKINCKFIKYDDFGKLAHLLVSQIALKFNYKIQVISMLIDVT